MRSTMPTKKHTTEKKRSGPKPQLISLYPLKFEEAVDILIKAKPKKRGDKDTPEEKGQNKKPA